MTPPVAPPSPPCFYCSISKIDPKNVYLSTSVLIFGCSKIFFWASESLISNLKSIKRAPPDAPCRPQPKTQPKIHKAGGRPLTPPVAPNPYGLPWSLMVVYGLLWSLMVPYGPVWSYMVSYGSIWSRLVLYGPVWSRMVPYGPVWTLWSRMVNGPLWSCMVPYAPVWSCMDPYGLVCSRVVPYSPVRSLMSCMVLYGPL